MSTLYIVPAKASDPEAYEIGLQRAQDGDITFCPDLAGNELEMLAGTWEGRKLFFEALLPKLREHLKEATEGVDRVHVDLGKETTTLYAALYCIMERTPVLITLHQAGIGGETLWALTHPMILRKAAMIVFARAETVFVPTVDVARFLVESMPRVQRDFVGAPIKGVRSLPPAGNGLHSK